MIDKTIGYGYNDLTIVPAVVSDITSRKECNPYTVDGHLPIFTAPMSGVINEHNVELWESNHIIPIIPRSVDYSIRQEFLVDGKFTWVALSMSEFRELFVVKHPVSYLNNSELVVTEFFVLIDLANGHMKSYFDLCNEAMAIADERGYTLHLMIGNIANPATYDYICRNVRCEYVRVGIGGGSGCTTSSNTSVHYPMATLVNECANIKDNLLGMNYNCPAIIADGGIRNFSDVIKALGLGADYVMIGGLFSSFLESAGNIVPTKYLDYNRKRGILGEIGRDVDEEWISEDEYIGIVVHIWDINESEINKRRIIEDNEIYKEFYGMSTKAAQKIINPTAELKTAEGCHKKFKVQYTIKQWRDNMEAFLKSAMSYTGKRTLGEFINNVTLKVNSACEIMAVNK